MKRTEQQNNAIHLYFELLAECLNASGNEVKKVMAVKTVDIPWSKDLVKSLLFKPIAEAMFDVTSTTQLTTTQINRVYEVLDRHISSNFGVHVEFPKEQTDGTK